MVKRPTRAVQLPTVAIQRRIRSARGPVTPEQWLAARQLSEGALPTRSLVANVLGVGRSAVFARSAAEGWKSIDSRHSIVVEAYARAADVAASVRGSVHIVELSADEFSRTANLVVTDQSDAAGNGDGARGPDLPDGAGAFVVRQLTRIIADADRRGGRLDKTQIDGLVSLSRMAERWEANATDPVGQDNKKSDKDLAAILGRIDDRIVELAQIYAEDMVRRGHWAKVG